MFLENWNYFQIRFEQTGTLCKNFRQILEFVSYPSTNYQSIGLHFPPKSSLQIDIQLCNNVYTLMYICYLQRSRFKMDFSEDAWPLPSLPSITQKWIQRRMGMGIGYRSAVFTEGSWVCMEIGKNYLSRDFG